MTIAAAGVGLSVDPSASAQPKRNQEQVRRVLEDWRDGKGSALMSLLSEDVRWTITGRSAVSGTTVGKQDLLANILTPFGGHFSTSQTKFAPTTIHSISAEGNLVIASFDGRGVTNKGLIYENTYAWFLTFEGTTAKEVTAFFDSIAFNELWAEK